jgi:hypothetical protein
MEKRPSGVREGFLLTRDTHSAIGSFYPVRKLKTEEPGARAP